MGEGGDWIDLELHMHKANLLKENLFKLKCYTFTRIQFLFFLPMAFANFYLLETAEKSAEMKRAAAAAKNAKAPAQKRKQSAKLMGPEGMNRAIGEEGTGHGHWTRAQQALMDKGAKKPMEPMESRHSPPFGHEQSVFAQKVDASLNADCTALLTPALREALLQLNSPEADSIWGRVFAIFPEADMLERGESEWQLRSSDRWLLHVVQRACQQLEKEREEEMEEQTHAWGRERLDMIRQLPGGPSLGKWAVAFKCLRIGDLVSASQMADQHPERNCSRLIEALDSLATDGKLEEEKRHELGAEWEKHGPACSDIHQRAIYGLLIGFDCPKANPAVLDQLWAFLFFAKFCAEPAKTLRQRQTAICDQAADGPDHFAALLFTGQLEQAIHALSKRHRVHAVHIALLAQQLRLLLTCGPCSSQILVPNTRQPSISLLNVPLLVRHYVKGFERTSVSFALNYCFFLRHFEMDTAPGKFGRSVFDAAVCRAVRLSGERDAILGQQMEGGQRVPGLVDKFARAGVHLGDLLECVASDTRARGDEAGADALYALAKVHSKEAAARAPLNSPRPMAVLSAEPAASEYVPSCSEEDERPVRLGGRAARPRVPPPPTQPSEEEEQPIPAAPRAAAPIPAALRAAAPIPAAPIPAAPIPAAPIAAAAPPQLPAAGRGNDLRPVRMPMPPANLPQPARAAAAAFPLAPPANRAIARAPNIRQPPLDFVSLPNTSVMSAPSPAAPSASSSAAAPASYSAVASASSSTPSAPSSTPMAASSSVPPPAAPAPSNSSASPPAPPMPTPSSTAPSASSPAASSASSASPPAPPMPTASSSTPSAASSNPVPPSSAKKKRGSRGGHLLKSVDEQIEEMRRNKRVTRGPAGANDFEEELEINGFPRPVQLLLSSPKVLGQVQKHVDVFAVRGTHYPPGTEPKPGQDRKLHLFLRARDERSLHKAEKELVLIIRRGHFIRA